MPDTDQKTKRCRRCGTRKPVTEFKLAKGRPLGISSWCRRCANVHYVANDYSAKRWAAERRAS